MTRYRIAVSALVAVCAVLAFTLPAGANQAATRATTVAVTAGKATEFHFVLSKKAVKHGTVLFKVTNKGNLPHDFKIAGHKTKLLVPGATQTLRVTLKKAGSYPYLCTVTGHAAAGMKGVFKAT